MRLKCERWTLDQNGEPDTGKDEIHTAEVRRGFDGKLWVHLRPGVTGYESASVEDLLKDNKLSNWPACAGTPGSWDRLVVPEVELERLKDILRLIPNL